MQGFRTEEKTQVSYAEDLGVQREGGREEEGLGGRRRSVVFWMPWMRRDEAKGMSMSTSHTITV